MKILHADKKSSFRFFRIAASVNRGQAERINGILKGELYFN